MKLNYQTFLAVILIFLLAVLIRFAYFNQNVYFSYDQARDFYFAGDILKGDIRLIGPPSAASDKLFPGPLSLYIYSIIQLFFGKNPEAYSIFFRLYNAFGVILVFLIGSNIFDKKVGILSATLYALSYEQSQYALLMSHQPLAVLTVLLLYLGLTMLLFHKRAYGLIFAALGLGLSIQLHFVYATLIPIGLGMLIILRKLTPKVRPKYILISTLLFLLTISTYIISEFKFNFRTISTVFTSTSKSHLYSNEAFYAANRFLHDTFLSSYQYTPYILILILLIFIYLIFKTKYKEKGFFLFLWLAGGILPYLISGTKGYYYSAAATVSLLILFSSLAVSLYRKYLVISIALISGVIINNQLLIRSQNPKGPNLEIVIQPGLLLSQEKKALDFIYRSADGKPFAVRALTVPLNVNTTWSYLFEWYGQSQYSFLPIWSEKPAEGFPGNLSYIPERSKLPETQFLIIEPTNGIRDEDKEKFFVEESYFTALIEEKDFGTIVIQRRRKI